MEGGRAVPHLRARGELGALVRRGGVRGAAVAGRGQHARRVREPAGAGGAAEAARGGAGDGARVAPLVDAAADGDGPCSVFVVAAAVDAAAAAVVVVVVAGWVAKRRRPRCRSRCGRRGPREQ